MTTNPFAQFSAGTRGAAVASSNGDGWVTAKKRGRDDNAIERDRKRALDARKKGRKKENISKKKSNRRNKSEDDEDLEGFVVDDDEEVENLSDTNDEEVIHCTKVNLPRGRRQIRNHNYNESNNSSDSEEIDTPPPKKCKQSVGVASKFFNTKKSVDTESSEDEDSFFPESFSKRSKPIDRKRVKKEVISKKPLKGKTTLQRKDTATTVMSSEEESFKDFEESSDEESLQIIDDNSSSESEDDNSEIVPESRLQKKNTARKNLQKQRANKKLSISSDSKTEVKINSFFTGLKENKKETITIDDSDSESGVDGKLSARPTEAKGGKTKKLLKKKQKRCIIDEEDDSENDGIFSPLAKKQVTSNLVSSADNSSTDKLFSDEDTTPLEGKGRRKRPKQHDESNEKLSENEQIAIALAMSESIHASQHSEEEELALDEEEDDEESVVLETLDEQHQEAQKVLKTANRLSQEVLVNMASWSNRHSGGDAAQGMIVDGALAINQYTTSNDGKGLSDHSWISHENIKELCSPSLKLADYQLIGVNWLALLSEMKVDIGDGNGTNVNGILADVMGLGKTVQTISFLAWLRSKNRKDEDNEDENETGNKRPAVKPHIIIVPASVLDNWMDEFQKFAPKLKVVKYHGSMETRKQLRWDLSSRIPQKSREVNPENCDIDVVLTTFSYFSGNKADDRAFLRRFNFDYMVIDEAHCLKNPNSNAYKNLDKLATVHRLLLTGTPVQNSPQELMSLICFLMPLFRSNSIGWEDEDETKNDGGARMLEYFVSLEGGDAKSDEDAYKKLKQLFAPFVLRRRKEDVLSQALPKKTREVVRVNLNPEMRTMYNSILSSHLSLKKTQAVGGTVGDRQHLFTALRKVANHPLLLRNRHTNDAEIEHLAKHLRLYGYFGSAECCTMTLVKRELKKMSDFDIHHAALDVIEENHIREGEMSRYVLQEKDLFCSPKLDKLRALIPALVNQGHRILIFSQWTNCLDLLGCLMESLDMKFFRLDGSTPISTRQQMINEFNEDVSIPVFLLSTKAGGMGINLTAADICILHDLDFNPFNDLQAEDRCHRIGQKKPVKVIKMVTNETVDEAIYEMQQRKTKMNAAILEKNGEQQEKKKDNEEIKSMLQHQFDRFLSEKQKTLTSKKSN